MPRRLLTTAVLLLALAACGDPDGEGVGGGPLPQQLEGEDYPGERAPVAGSVVLGPTGCWLLDVDGTERLAVWPAGSEQGEGPVVRLPGGGELADGDRVDGVGTVMPVARLTGVPDGYWGMTVGFCTPEASDVVVLDEVSAP